MFGLEYGETIWAAKPEVIDGDNKKWKFTPDQYDGTLSGSMFEFNFLGRCGSSGITTTSISLCSPDDVGGDGETPTTQPGQSTTQRPTDTTQPGDITTTPPIAGLCNGPDGNRVAQSEQSIVAFNPAGGKYDLNEVLHKSILFYEVHNKGCASWKMKF